MSTAEVIAQVAPPPLSSTPIDRSTGSSLGLRALIFGGVALALGCMTANWLAKSRYEIFTGYLEARTHTVAFERDARVAQVLVRSGKVISVGQPLLTLEDGDLLQKINRQKQIVDELKLKVDQLEAVTQSELEQKRASLQDKIFEIQARSLALLRQRIGTGLEGFSTAPVDHFPGLAYLDTPVDPSLPQLKPISAQSLPLSSGALAPKTGSSANSSVRIALTTEIQLCEKRLAELNTENQGLPERTRRQTGLHVVQSQLTSALADLSALEKRQQALTINAPGTGIVGVYSKTAGEHVKANEAIVQVLDRDQPHLLLQIASNRVADFPAGTIVELKFPGDEFAKGKVAEVPPQTANSPGLTVSETRTAVQIVPAGLLWPNLPCGTMVEVRRQR